jgi:hypothetical protein
VYVAAAPGADTAAEGAVASILNCVVTSALVRPPMSMVRITKVCVPSPETTAWAWLSGMPAGS